MFSVLERAIEAYWRQVFLDALNADFAALRADADAWSAEMEERAEWDVTLGDGSEDD